ncbi:molybdopterin-dependent oxidoreductase [Shigella flexneri]
MKKTSQGTTVNRWLTTGMLCASAASNETGMLTQKFTRSLGTRHQITRCVAQHGPTVASLAPDLVAPPCQPLGRYQNANVVVAMEVDSAEAHPVGSRWAMEAKNNNDATLIVVDPRFTRTASVADIYTPIRSGTDITFLSGVIRSDQTTNPRRIRAPLHQRRVLVRDDYAFDDGLFSGYDAKTPLRHKTTWNYQFGEDGYALRDDTLQHPQCVWNLLKTHVSRYTPDMVKKICAHRRDTSSKSVKFWRPPARPTVRPLSCTASAGLSILSVRRASAAMAMIQLLLGNMGVAGGGANALRGHSNIQELTDLGLGFPPACLVI